MEHLLPSHIVATISLVVLALAILGRYVLHLAGAGRLLYVVGSVVALYLNCFVAMVQAFLKVPALHALAPNGKEPPFVAAQLVVAIFIGLGIVAAKRFRVQAAMAQGVGRKADSSCLAPLGCRNDKIFGEFGMTRFLGSTAIIVLPISLYSLFSFSFQKCGAVP